MSGEERLQVGLHLHELACEIARDSIRALLPNASVAEVEEELRLRRRMAYEINTQPQSRSGFIVTSLHNLQATFGHHERWVGGSRWLRCWLR